MYSFAFVPRYRSRSSGSEMVFTAALYILAHLLHSVDCVSPSEREAMYGEVLARAQQRKVVADASVGKLNKMGRPRMYSVEQAQLIKDVTLHFGDAISSAD